MKANLYDMSIDRKYILKLLNRKELVEGKKISILSDTMFKAMFQNDNRIKYSAKLISYFIDMSYDEILENIHLSKNELDKEKENTKGEKSDYVATLNDMKINIEVNNNAKEITMERNLEYLHRLYSSKIKVGKKYNYPKVIQINLNNFAFKGNDKILDEYYIQNDGYIRYNKKIKIIQIYVPNLRKKMYTKDNQKLTELEKYILTLVEQDINKIKEMGVNKIMNEYIEEAVEVSHEEINFGEAYDKEWALQDQAYTDGKEDGREEGREEGYQDGKEDGIEEGMEVGALSKAKTIAKSMLKDQVDMNFISKYTNLSVEEIKSL